MPRLLLNFGSPEQYEIALHPGTQSLGRDITNDISIDDASISAAHCQIVVEPDTVIVNDLGSANGTFIDAQPIRQGALSSGQTLRVGGVELLFDADTPADLIAATAVPATAAGALEPPIPPPLPMPEPARGAAVCQNHRKAVPRYECKGCGGLFCDLCVTTRRVEGAQRKFCRACGGECAWLSAGDLFQPVEEKTFFEHLPRAFMYPFQGDGWILMGTGTLFFMFAEFLILGSKFGGFFVLGAVGTVSIFAYGYLFAYQMKIIAETARGKDQMPDWPDFTGMGDVAGPFWHVLAVLLVCFLPGWIAMYMFSEEEWGRGLSLTILALGGFYLPMAFLAVSMFEALEVLNPLFIIPSILRVWQEYAVACGVLVVTVILQIAIAAVLGRFFDVPLVSGFVSGFVGLYFITVEMRVLGLLYRTQQDVMGWFKR